MYQNQWEAGSSHQLGKGEDIIAIGALWDHTQLNVINNNSTRIFDIQELRDLCRRFGPQPETRSGVTASRYYRSDTVGAYINDDFKFAAI